MPKRSVAKEVFSQGTERSERLQDMQPFFSGQISSRPHHDRLAPNWWFSKGNPLISGKNRLVKYYNLVSFFGHQTRSRWNLEQIEESFGHQKLIRSKWPALNFKFHRLTWKIKKPMTWVAWVPTTIDGWNLAPPEMHDTLWIMVHLPYELVQDFFHQQYFVSF